MNRKRKQRIEDLPFEVRSTLASNNRQLLHLPCEGVPGHVIGVNAGFIIRICLWYFEHS